MATVARTSMSHAASRPLSASSGVSSTASCTSGPCRGHTAPGCGAAAVGCDLDHTLAWDKGGITYECGLALPCK
jgi:hypothetical protein